MDALTLFEGKPFSIQKQVVVEYDHAVRHRYLLFRQVLRLDACYFQRDHVMSGK
jgi:hypothetical protein